MGGTEKSHFSEFYSLPEVGEPEDACSKSETHITMETAVN